MGADDFNGGGKAVKRADKTHDLAQPRVAILEEPKRDGMAKVGRETGGGDVAMIVGRIDRTVGVHQMRTRRHRVSGVHGFDPDLPQITSCIQPLALGEFRADAVLGLADHPRHAEVLRGGCAVQFVARRVALFDTHDA